MTRKERAALRNGWPTECARGHAKPAQWYTCTEVACVLGVTRVAAWYWIASGELRAFKGWDGRYRITPAELERFVTARAMRIAKAG